MKANNLIQMAHFAMDMETLNISPGDATESQIKEAYRRAKAKAKRLNNRGQQ